MPAEQIWRWSNSTGRMLEVGWSHAGTDALTTATNPAVVLIHGFGANTDHWRHTMPALGARPPLMPLT